MGSGLDSVGKSGAPLLARSRPPPPSVRDGSDGRATTLVLCVPNLDSPPAEQSRIDRPGTRSQQCQGSTVAPEQQPLPRIGRMREEVLLQHGVKRHEHACNRCPQPHHKQYPKSGGESVTQTLREWPPRVQTQNRVQYQIRPANQPDGQESGTRGTVGERREESAHDPNENRLPHPSR